MVLGIKHNVKLQRELDDFRLTGALN